LDYDFCSSDFSATPFWWGQTEPSPIEGPPELPESVDVLIVGSGYTGLHCALQTAEAGRDTLVLDAERPGWGCSTRNGGQISGEIKPGFAELQQRYGSEQARALILEARDALHWLGDYVDGNGIDCDYRRCGRFVAAHSPRRFRELAHDAEHQRPELARAVRVVPPGDQRGEIDSDYYHGGLVIDSHCSLDPYKYHFGLLELARHRGVGVAANCRAERIEKLGDGYRVTTSRGSIKARDLVIATNGYTGGFAPWQQRRIIPIGSYMLATEAMDAERACRLMPRDRVFSDTRKIVVYFRKSPDGRRLLFGGRVSVFESDPVKSLPALRRELLRIFPQLEDVKISHTWMGFVGYTFDNLPHLGREDGIYYAMGYCGSGICLASYLGHRLGLQVAGKAEGETAFNRASFQTRPLYRGKPWFLAAAVRYYQMLDRLG
jgi:glycine/D-amino acid oxidase-like deaminating enzyme